MQKMSHVAKNFFIHTAGLFYQEEQNAAEKEFFQHNKKKSRGVRLREGVRIRHSSPTDQVIGHS